MIRAFLAAIAVAVGVGGQTESQPPARDPATPPPFVLAVEWHEGGTPPSVARRDPLTLRSGGRSVDLRPGGGSPAAFSPNRKKLALGTPEPGIEIVDVRHMRRVGFVRLGGIGWLTSLSWQRGTLFAVVMSDDRTYALVVDPIGRQVLRRHRLDRTLLAAEPERGGMVLLTAPPGRIGPVEVSVLGGKGLESVPISGITGGGESSGSGSSMSFRQVVPGLAVDEDEGRALVISAANKVATVDLGDLAVDYHEVSDSVSLLSRFRNWLEPAAEAKIVEGPLRQAVTLGNGLVAVSGVDYSGATSKPAGLALMDTHDWSLRELDDKTSYATRVGATLLGYGGGRSGLVGYDLQGRQLFHLFNGRRIDAIETAGGLGYVYLGSQRRIIVDAASGRILGRTKPGFVSVVGG
jgi:hypothetical protein